jgi:putative colanic acid biosynthesis UDP-glucose lipid carrier transferase
MQPLAGRERYALTDAVAHNLEKNRANGVAPWIGLAPPRPRSLTLLVDGLAAIEVLIAVVTSLVAKLAYLDLYRGIQPNLPYLGLGLLLALILHFVYRQLGLYDEEALRASSVNAPKVVGGLLMSFLLLLGFIYFLKISDFYSRGWVLVWIPLSAVLVSVTRIAVLRYAKRLAAEGLLRRRVAICGAPSMAHQLKEHLGKSCLDVEVVGIYDDKAAVADLDLSIAGGLERLIADARGAAFDQVILTLPALERDRIWNALESLAVLPLDVQLCTEPFALGVPVHGSRTLGGAQVRLLLRRPLSERSALAKCCLDYFVATLALAAVAPLWAMVALAIKLESKGPVLFRQRRIGQNQKVFHVYKFRTMSVMEDGGVVKQAERNDSRVTRIGRLLRRTSMDELPQLINVLKGEMSIVGPRPHAVVHDEEFMRRLDHYSRRHRVKPGITGWAQVNGLRGETRTSEQLTRRMEHDLYYVANWSIWFDLEIMLRTFAILLPGRNAY